MEANVKNGLSILLVGFITVVLGLILVDVVGDLVYENTNLFTITNNTITPLYGYDELQESTVNGISFIGNSTDDYSSLIGTSNINVSRNGSIWVNNQTLRDNLPYNVSYSYEEPLYVREGTSRTLISLITIFFVMGVFIVGYLVVKRFFGL